MFVTDNPEQLKEAALLQSGVKFKNEYRCVEYLSYPKCKIEDINILPLNVVDYITQGNTFIERPVEDIWYRDFYNLENGTPFEAAYRFHISYIPEKPIFAMIEMAQNLDLVLVNGKPAVFTNEKVSEYFDPCFSRVILHNVVQGENTICIKGKKCSNINGIGSHTRVPMGNEHKPTELESIYLCGDFGVANTDDGEYEIVKAPEYLQGSAISSQYPFYLGRISCAIGKVYGDELIRAETKAHAAELRINGKRKEISYLYPFEFEIPRDCNGEAEIILYNSLENTFGPLHLAERNMLSVMGPVYFQDMSRYVKQPVLFEYGLMNISVLRKRSKKIK